MHQLNAIRLYWLIRNGIRNEKDKEAERVVMRVPYKAFGKVKLVPLRVYQDGEMLTNTEPVWDDELWVERDEDLYALDSSQLRDKRVLVVYRNDWLISPDAEKSEEVREVLPKRRK